MNSSQISYRTPKSVKSPSPKKPSTSDLPNTPSKNSTPHKIRAATEYHLRRDYRPTRPLQWEMRDHCQIYFEAEQYIAGITLLLNLITSGTSSGTLESPSPAFAPPEQYISLAGTLLVHPGLTTFNPSRDDLIASNMSLRLLRTILLLLGPMNACLNTAFVFSSANNVRRSRSNRLLQVEDPSEPIPDAETLDLGLATTDSLWARAEDFWHVVGWSLSCAAVYPHRWTRWKLWLDYMLSVLENDFEDRSRLALNSNPFTSPLIPESLIFQYITSGVGAFGGVRRILRAVFSTGTPRNLTDFPAIFTKETQEPSTKKPTSDLASFSPPSSKPINIDADDYGDYIPSSPIGPPSPTNNDNNNNDTTTEIPASRSNPKNTSYATHALRVRLLTLLNSTTHHPYPPLSQRVLSDTFTDSVLELPLAAFMLYTTTPPFLPTALLRPVLSTVSASPLPPPADNEPLSLAILERKYAAYPARHAGAMENARVALLLEALAAELRTGNVDGGDNEDDCFSEGFKKAVQKGNVARREKGGLGKRRKGKEVEEEAWDVLVASEGRLKRMIGI